MRIEAVSVELFQLETSKNTLWEQPLSFLGCKSLPGVKMGFELLWMVFAGFKDRSQVLGYLKHILGSGILKDTLIHEVWGVLRVFLETCAGALRLTGNTKIRNMRLTKLD